MKDWQGLEKELRSEASSKSWSSFSRLRISALENVSVSKGCEESMIRRFLRIS